MEPVPVCLWPESLTQAVVTVVTIVVVFVEVKVNKYCLSGVREADSEA